MAFYDDEKALLHSRSERERKKRLIYLYIRQQSVAVFRFFRRRKAIGETSTIISIGVRTCKDLRATESARALPPSTSSYVHQRPSSSSSRSPPSLSFFFCSQHLTADKRRWDPGQSLLLLLVLFAHVIRCSVARPRSPPFSLLHPRRDIHRLLLLLLPIFFFFFFVCAWAIFLFPLPSRYRRSMKGEREREREKKKDYETVKRVAHGRLLLNQLVASCPNLFQRCT